MNLNALEKIGLDASNAYQSNPVDDESLRRFETVSVLHWQALLDVAKAGQDIREIDAVMKKCGGRTAKWASFMQEKVQAEKRLDAALTRLEAIK